MSTSPSPVSTVPSEQSNNVFQLYFSNPASMQYVFTDGTTAQFVAGRFWTDVPTKISQLDEMVKLRRNISRDVNMLTISGDATDPLMALRARFFAEFQEQQAANLNPTQDLGTSVQGAFKAASTTDIAPVTAGGDSTARLNSIKSAISAKTSTF